MPYNREDALKLYHGKCDNNGEEFKKKNTVYFSFKNGDWLCRRCRVKENYNDLWRYKVSEIMESKKINEKDLDQNDEYVYVTYLANSPSLGSPKSFRAKLEVKPSLGHVGCAILTPPGLRHVKSAGEVKNGLERVQRVKASPHGLESMQHTRVYPTFDILR